MINCNAHSDRWKMLALAMHCSALISQLVHLKYNRMSIDEDGQTRLFQMTIEQREDFAKFAANLRFIITPWTNERNEEYWKELGKHEYTDYEFHTLFDSFYKEKTEAVVVLLEKIGNGEALNEDETDAVTEFLHLLNGRALARIDHGGCF